METLRSILKIGVALGIYVLIFMSVGQYKDFDASARLSEISETQVQDLEGVSWTCECLHLNDDQSYSEKRFVYNQIDYLKAVDFCTRKNSAPEVLNCHIP